MKTLGYKLLFFFIYPFGAFLQSLFDIKNKNSRIIIYLWFVLFGLAFTAENPAADSFRYVQDFKVEKNLDKWQYREIIKEYFTFDSNTKDLYTTTVNYFIGKYTDNYHYTFLIYSIVFGFFYVLCMRYVLHPKIRNKWVFYSIFLILFCFSNPIVNINGVRFWTAAWIAVFCMFKIFVDNDKRYLFLAGLTPLIHGGYFLFLMVLLIALLVNKCTKILMVGFCVSIFFSVTAFMSVAEAFIDSFPKFVQNMFLSYSEHEFNVLTSHYSSILNNIPNYYIILLILLIINEYRKRRLVLTPSSTVLLGVILLWFSFVNFTSAFPSVGIRFRQLGLPLLAFFWLQNYENLRKYNKVILLLPIVYSYKILYWYRLMASISSFYLYLSPLPVVLYKFL